MSKIRNWWVGVINNRKVSKVLKWLGVDLIRKYRLKLMNDLIESLRRPVTQKERDQEQAKESSRWAEIYKITSDDAPTEVWTFRTDNDPYNSYVFCFPSKEAALDVVTTYLKEGHYLARLVTRCRYTDGEVWIDDKPES